MVNKCVDIDINGQTSYDNVLINPVLKDPEIIGAIKLDNIQIGKDCDGDPIVSGENTHLATCNNLSDFADETHKMLLLKQDKLNDIEGKPLPAGAKIVTDDDLHGLDKKVAELAAEMPNKQDKLKDADGQDLPAGTRVVSGAALDDAKEQLTKAIHDAVNSAEADIKHEVDEVTEDMTKAIGKVKDDLTKSIDGVATNTTQAINKVKDDLTKAVAAKQDELHDLEGEPLKAGTKVPSDLEFISAVNDITVLKSQMAGKQGQLKDKSGHDLTDGTMVALPADVDAVTTRVNNLPYKTDFKDCENKPIPAGAAIATCVDLKNAISGGGGGGGSGLKPGTPPGKTTESSIPTTLYGKRTAVMGEPDTFLKAVVDGKTYVLAAYEIKS